MSKSADADLTNLASDASEIIGPLSKQAEKAQKMTVMMAKSPNPKMAEALADLVADIIADAERLKPTLKDLRAASK